MSARGHRWASGPQPRRRPRPLAALTRSLLVATAFVLGGCGATEARPDHAVVPSSTRGEAGVWTATPEPVDVNDLDALARGTGSRADAQLRAGDAAWKAGDSAAAERAYGEAQRLAPNDPAPIVGIARARQAAAAVPTGFNSAPENATLRAVTAELRRAVAMDPSYAPAQLELGRALLVLGDGEGALSCLSKAVAMADRNAEAHSALGIAQLAMGQLRDAVKSLERAAALDPDRAERHENLGTALLLAQRTDDAIAALRRASMLAPDDAVVRSNLGAAYLASGQPTLAAVELQIAVARAPDVAAHHANLGQAKLLTGQLDAAATELGAAVKLDPKLTSAWLNLGNVLAKKDLYPDARKAYEAARALEPDDPTVRGALDDLDKLEKQQPKSKHGTSGRR